MTTQPSVKSTPSHARTFSALWTEELGAAIFEAAPKGGYTMRLVANDRQRVITAVNQGIDSHLNVCFLPSRGDRFNFRSLETAERRFGRAELEARISPESLTVLVRRLMESEDDAAASLAFGICQTLGMQLI